MRPVPPAATCRLHPKTAATAACSRCGSFGCPQCLSAINGQWRCSACAERVAPFAGPLASRTNRLLAALVDGVLVLVPALIIAFIVGVTDFKDPSHSPESRALMFFIKAFMVALAIGVISMVVSVFQLLAQLRWGQSFGKRLMAIKVVRSNGAEMELWRLIVLRNLVTVLLSQTCAALWLVDACLIFGQRQQCLHDLLADSAVIDVSSTQQ